MNPLSLAGNRLRFLASLMRERLEEGEGYVLILGAGASLASGAASTAQIVERLIRDLGRERDAATLSWDEKLVLFYQVLDGLDVDERHVLLRRHLKDLEPSPGYRHLSALIEAGYFHLILTTNFDLLLENALIRSGLSAEDFTVLVNGRDKETAIARQLVYSTPRVKVLKLHGDLNARLFAFTPEEIFQFGESIEGRLRDLLDGSLIIVGHSLRDPDLNRCIRARGGAVWYVNPTPPSVSEFAGQAIRARGRDRVISGELGRFDEFFSRLRQELSFERPSVTRGKVGYRPGGRSLSPPELEPATSSALEVYTRDLTAEAARGRVQPAFAVDGVVRSIGQVLSQRESRNPLLIGDTGVGKTAIIRTFAHRLGCEENIIPTLRGRRVLELAVDALIAATPAGEEPKQRLERLLAAVKEAAGLFVVLDDLHRLVASGSGSGLADLLKASLVRRELTCIAATTPAAYARYIEPDSDLRRCFEPIHTAEPSTQDSFEILAGLRPGFQAHYGGLEISDQALRTVVRLAGRYLEERLPGKAVQLLERACARASIPSLTQGKQPPSELEEPIIYQVLAERAGISAARLAREELLVAEEEARR